MPTAFHLTGCSYFFDFALCAEPSQLFFVRAAQEVKCYRVKSEKSESEPEDGVSRRSWACEGALMCEWVDVWVRVLAGSPADKVESRQTFFRWRSSTSKNNFPRLIKMWLTIESIPLTQNAGFMFLIISNQNILCFLNQPMAFLHCLRLKHYFGFHWNVNSKRRIFMVIKLHWMYFRYACVVNHELWISGR